MVRLILGWEIADLSPISRCKIPVAKNPKVEQTCTGTVCNDAYPVHSTPPPAGRNNACLTPAATPDSGPNCSPTPSPSRRAFPDIMASLDVQPRLMEARPDPYTPAQMRAAVARYLAANALKDKALSTASPSPIQPNNKSTVATQHPILPSPEPAAAAATQHPILPSPEPAAAAATQHPILPSPEPADRRKSGWNTSFTTSILAKRNKRKKHNKKEVWGNY
ncbi:unnamed protein product [Boreogadus saida]